MKKYDFDKIIDRKNTDCIKYDYIQKLQKDPDTLPLWVADMDFPVADPIIEAIRKVCDNGIFGYSDVGDDYYEAVAGWFTRRFGWTPEKSWMVLTPGVVFAISVAVRTFTEPEEAVLIQTPVYYPFSEAIKKNRRTLVENPLVRDGLTFKIDFDDFEKKIIEENVKMFILCSPHNPVGRVWTKEELRKMADICAANDVLIISDEIHCDITAPGHKHTLLPDLCPELKDRIICCTAPSKTFNLAGLQNSNIWIPSPSLRKKYTDALEMTGFYLPNQPGMVACRAAYSEGEEWFDQCLEYIFKNYDFLKSYIAENIPQLTVMDLQGTYLAWVDFSGLGLTPDEVDGLVCQKAKLWLDEGRIFGTGGDNFQRFVLACPRAILAKALERLNEVINGVIKKDSF